MHLDKIAQAVKAGVYAPVAYRIFWIGVVTVLHGTWARNIPGRPGTDQAALKR